MTTFMSRLETERRIIAQATELLEDTTVEISGRRLQSVPGGGPTRELLAEALAASADPPPTGCMTVVDGLVAYVGLDARRAVQVADLGAGVVFALPVLHDAREAADEPNFRPVLATPFADVPIPDAARHPGPAQHRREDTL